MHLQQRLPLLIFIGSRRAGRMIHQQRLVDSQPHLYSPVQTITTRAEEKPGDDRWYVRTSRENVARYRTSEMLTFFEEGDALFFIPKKQVMDIRTSGRTPLVGMTPVGYERLHSRNVDVYDIPTVAVLLQPANPYDFCDRLIHEHGLDPEKAEEEMQRAVRLSTVPPAVGKRESVVPVPIYGNASDVGLIDEALAALLPP
ncbi:MAG TPA: hypothetical protein VN397_01785 [Candidatus Methylomirabilis sp.]|nr:hypothetical protein [Candidatus Methylomirabilis sp.]